eukprot:gene8324-14289_t
MAARNRGRKYSTWLQHMHFHAFSLRVKGSLLMRLRQAGLSEAKLEVFEVDLQSVFVSFALTKDFPITVLELSIE